MNLRQLPTDGTLAVESSKLIVKTVQNFKVLCHADSIIDDDDEMIEFALLNLAASRRQKDRAPSSMILHRHMQNRDSQQFSPHQNSIVHQKLRGQSDLDNDFSRANAKELPVARSETVLPNLSAKIAVAPTFLQLFDLDSSRTGRTNECSVNQSSMRIEISTPVRSARSAIEQFSCSNVPGCPDTVYMPAAKGKPRTPLAMYEHTQTCDHPSSSVELAAPYSKNYVENYKSKIRHSRLGNLFGQLRHVGTPKNSVRPEHLRNRSVENDADVSQQQTSTPEFFPPTFQRRDRLQTADSVLVSSPSQGSHVDSDGCLERDTEIAENCDNSVDESHTSRKGEKLIDNFEEIERERMLEQVQKMYLDVPVDATMAKIGPERNIRRSQRESRLQTTDHEVLKTKPIQAVFNSRKRGAASKSLTVMMPHNEARNAPARDFLAEHSEVFEFSAKQSAKQPEIIDRASQNHYRMSVNILRPFESIVDVAHRSCVPTAKMDLKNQHSTPVAVMFASSSLMN